MRDNGFIKSDDDIDVGILEGNFSWSNLEACLNEIGMEKMRQFELNGKITEQTYKKKGVCVDFFLYMKNENGYTANVYWIDPKRKYSTEMGHSVMYRDCPVINEFTTKKVMSVEVITPTNYEEYLVANYGNSWRKPDPDYKPEKYVRTEEYLEAQRIDFEGKNL